MPGDTGSGGGISNSGDLTVTNCTFSGNSGQYVGGIYNGGTLAATLINQGKSGVSTGASWASKIAANH